MALPATDDFTGTAGTYLSSRTGWTTGQMRADMYLRTGGYCAAEIAGSTNYAAYRWIGDAFNGNHYSQALAQALFGSSGIGVTVRCQSASNSYYGFTLNTAGAKIVRCDSGTLTTLVFDELTYTAGFTMRLEVNGTALTAIYNGSTVLSTTDATYSGGGAGIHGTNDLGSSQMIDNWEGGNIGGSSTPVPVFMAQYRQRSA